MIDRYDFFSRPLSFRQMVDRLLEDAFIMPGGNRSAGGQPFGGRGAINVYEEGDKLVVEAELPGFKPDEINISIERGTLTIRGQRKAEEERKERNYLIREHRVGSVMRTFQLPETVNPDAAQATFEHGVLRLIFPRAEQHRPRRIKVQAGGQPAIAAASDGQRSMPSGGEQGSQAPGEAVAAGQRT